MTTSGETMKKMVALGAVLALIGCAPQISTVAWKPGTTSEARQADIDDCQIAAMKDVPKDVRTDYDPGFSSPGTVQCNTIGTSTYCNTVGAVNIPGSVSQYDANSPLRTRVADRCLRAKGYEIFQLPKCLTQDDINYRKAHPFERPKCSLT